MFYESNFWKMDSSIKEKLDKLVGIIQTVRI